MLYDILVLLTVASGSQSLVTKWLKSNNTTVSVAPLEVTRRWHIDRLDISGALDVQTGSHSQLRPQVCSYSTSSWTRAPCWSGGAGRRRATPCTTARSCACPSRTGRRRRRASPRRWWVARPTLQPRYTHHTTPHRITPYHTTSHQ